MSEAARDIYWRPAGEVGLEQLHLRPESEGGARALGFILRKLGERHVRCRYELVVDAAWRTRRLSIAVTGPDESDARRLLLEGDGAGNWRSGEAARPELAGCLDVDLQASPFTNTLPIRRLGLEAGAAAPVRAVYVAFPGLDVQAAEQRYTCLAPLGANGGRYRYDDAGPFSGFTAELAVDADGLVLDYPELFERVWPR